MGRENEGWGGKGGNEGTTTTEGERIGREGDRRDEKGGKGRGRYLSDQCQNAFYASGSPNWIH